MKVKDLASRLSVEIHNKEEMMNSSQITSKVIRNFPYMNEFFITRVRLESGWGVFIPSNDEEEEQELMCLFGHPEQKHKKHDLMGIVIPLSEDESASLDELQREFNKAGGYGSIR